ncbi:ankyrin repeat-containing domain protein, partial [Mycena capillaripes]
AIQGRGIPDTLWELIEKGADINAQAQGCDHATALQLVVFHEDSSSVAKLLAHGADPNIQGVVLCTALQLACVVGKLESITLLLKSGADPNIAG